MSLWKKCVVGNKKMSGVKITVNYAELDNKFEVVSRTHSSGGLLLIDF